MKMIDMECPNCTAPLRVDPSKKRAVCEHCGATFLLDDDKQLMWMDTDQDVVDTLYESESKPIKNRTWIWATAALVVFVCIALAILLPWGAKRRKDAMKYSWESIALHQELPQPPSEYGILAYSNENAFSLEVRRMSEAQFTDYRAACSEAGYTVERREGDSYMEAFREDGFFTELWYDRKEKAMNVTLQAPKSMGTLRWPTSALGLMVPEPDSKVGTVEYETPTNFVVLVGETSPEDFGVYVERCMEFGFDIDYNRSTEYFNAENEYGVKLNLSYEGFHVMRISADASELTPETTTQETTTQEVTTQGESTTASQTTTQAETATERVTRDPGEVREDLKTFLADYEAFVDEYCTFLAKYFASNQPMALMGEYIQYAGDYLQWSLKAESWAGDLTEAETKLFSEVMIRCTAKVAAFTQ